MYFDCLYMLAIKYNTRPICVFFSPPFDISVGDLYMLEKYSPGFLKRTDGAVPNMKVRYSLSRVCRQTMWRFCTGISLFMKLVTRTSRNGEITLW